MGQVEYAARSQQSACQPAPQRWSGKDFIQQSGTASQWKCATFSYQPTSPQPNGSFENKGSKYDSFKNGDAPNPVKSVASGPSEPSLKRTASHEAMGEDWSAQENTEVEATYLEQKRRSDFRSAFLHKLSNEKVLVPPEQRPPKHQSVIIFDWDDTLLCTSFLNHNEGTNRNFHPTVQRHLRGIAKATASLLETASQLGRTFIITNAQEGWVEYSASKWVPELLPLLKNIDIISARSRYEEHFPHDVSKWKVNAFLDVQRSMDSQVVTNLNSLGDANYEMDATLTMGRYFEQALIKTIKFKEHPSPEELLRELELVATKLESIVTNARNMRISLERKQG